MADQIDGVVARPISPKKQNSNPLHVPTGPAKAQAPPTGPRRSTSRQQIGAEAIPPKSAPKGPRVDSRDGLGTTSNGRPPPQSQGNSSSQLTPASQIGQAGSVKSPEIVTMVGTRFLPLTNPA